MQKHRQLLAWQRCLRLAVETHRITVGFPAAERFGLTSQLRRATVSAAANIAEGCARFGHREFSHALSMALGSLAEVDTLLEVASGYGVLTASQHQELEALRRIASQTTYRLQRSLRAAS
jgi:four helix bundle protein